MKGVAKTGAGPLFSPACWSIAVGTTRALGSGERVLYTAERPAFIAKNRYGLPDVLPLDWDAFAAAMPKFD